MRGPDISVVVTNYNYGTYIRRCLRSLHMIALAHRQHKMCRLRIRGHRPTSFFVCKASSARRMPSAPGFTPTGET